MKFRILSLTLITAFLFSATAHAQSTWDNIYTILNTNCSSETCHGSGSANPSFNVDTSAAVLYAQLINGDPTNPYAKDSVNNKLVIPSSPETSFLMRKIARCSTNALALTQPFEGEIMPASGANRLSDADLDLIFNWILQGASDTAVIDPDTVAGDICDLNVGIRTLPSEIVSLSAYPNPATDIFSLSYTLQHSALVTMDLLDVTGQKIETIFIENQNSGKQIKTILPDTHAGIFLIRLTIGNSSQYIEKIVLH